MCHTMALNIIYRRKENKFIIFSYSMSSLFYVWYCQSTKAKVTLWSVDLIEGLNCWNML